MTTTDDERHCRICLMLMNGGTKISKALFEKCMKVQTPENHIPHPWSLDDFLRANETKILGTETGKAKKKIIFSAQGVSSQVEEWDLYMYCFFLIEIVDVECRVRMDIKQLRKIRNKICHLNEPKIGIEKYNRTVDKLGVIYERLLKEICDEELTIEVNRIIKASKEDPLSTKEIIFTLHKFYKTDLETREILTQQNAETREILTQQNAELSCNVKTLMKKMDDIEKKQNLMLSRGLVDCEFENCTETCVELRIKNCPSCTERFISNALVSMYKKETGQPSNEQLYLSEETRTEMMAAVKDTVASFASKKRAIIDVEQNCVILLLNCSTVNSLLSLFYDCINGDLNKEFQKLESAVRQIKGLEEVSLEAVLYMDEFYRTMHRTGIVVYKNDLRQKLQDVG
ncbi:uncharacterized protein LOC132750955 [Ruditapes philippinarum]|uniref:uncharacterized protein LOC132750955 n=1 Tax=Ruditapes philippinarum TaxID=129788 RepID=UPI00295BD76E|nr:uncharacterized protein LOC132750955 [Ruditapes philippinarum]